MVIFAGFIVLAHDGFPIFATVQPVLEPMRAARFSLWQLPNLALQDSPILQNRFGIEYQRGLAHFDGILYHHRA